MLRKVGRKRARVPLTREGVNSSLLMLTAGPVWMKSAALHHSNNASAIGLSELVLLTGIPNQSCLCPCIPLDYSKMRGVFSRPLLGGEKRNPPPDSFGNWRGTQGMEVCRDALIYHERYSFHTYQPKLDGCKIREYFPTVQRSLSLIKI